VEKSTKAFADARGVLTGLVQELNEIIEQTKRERLPAIKRALAKTAERQAELKALVETAPGLFERPRTVIFHGIKVGFAKGKGIITWDDDEKVATLIQRHLPEQYEVLVKTTRKPLKTPLKELSVADLKKIGCTVEETADYVVISPVDSEVDKLVSAMLKDAIDSETASQN
jgi:hypothetical protein